MTNEHTPCRIVLTGGPGAGKTTAASLLRREIGEEIVVVPEAATMLFSGGFPRCNTPLALKATQRAIYYLQKGIEAVQAERYPHRILLCDRGTLDSSVYWPEGSESFYSEVNTSLEQELSRYDAVVFFETAAAGNNSIEGGNPYRYESLEEAIRLDNSLREVWQKHHNFHLISHENSFMKKINKALDCIQAVIEKHHENI